MKSKMDALLKIAPVHLNVRHSEPDRNRTELLCLNIVMSAHNNAVICAVPKGHQR